MKAHEVRLLCRWDHGKHLRLATCIALFVAQPSEGIVGLIASLGAVALLRACTHKIAVGDSDLINVRFGAFCRLELLIWLKLAPAASHFVGSSEI
jgi:hypothetical protein